MKYFCCSIILFFLSCNITVKENLEPLYSYDVEQKILDLGITLNQPKVPPGLKIELATRSDNHIYLSGNGPIGANGEKTVGKVGVDLTVEEGYAAARLTAINHLSVLKHEIGDLNKVVKVVKVLGMVNCGAVFVNHPKVINGYSDLMLAVFGVRGKHTRSAVGMHSLPWNLACEVETIIEIRD